MADVEQKVPVHGQGMDHLEDDKMNQNTDFTGATLQINSNAPNGNEPTVGFAGTGVGFSRDRPGSTVSKKTTGSTGSKTNMSPGVIQTDVMAKSYFCQRTGVFENAVEMSKSLIKHEMDGDLKGGWLLTEIDHWDNNREKLILLTDWSLIIVKFDFIAMKIVDSRRIMLHIFEHVQTGDFIYPEKSIMPPRQHGGLRASWNRGGMLSFGQKWNPFASDIPWVNFSHHPLIYNEKERDTITYNVDDFYESFVQQVNHSFNMKKPGQALQVCEGPIMIESYASLSSMVFNQSHLGYSRERGGVSF